MQQDKAILETTVTWEMVETVLKASLGTNSCFGIGKHGVRIGEGQGFMSKVALLTLDWSDDDIALPEKVVLKIVEVHIQDPDIGKELLTGNEIQDIIEEGHRQSHNAEMSFYENVGKYDFLPKYYGGLKFDEFNKQSAFLILEYIPNAVFRQFYDKLEVSVIEEILDKIAQLASESLLNPTKFNGLDAERDSSRLERRKELIKAEPIKKCISGMIEIMPELEVDGELLIEKTEMLLDVELLRSLENVNGHTMLCHGNLWAGNFLFREIDGKLVINKIVDYQTTKMSSPSMDFFEILNVHLPENDDNLTENAHNRFIEFYYHALEKHSKLKLHFSVEELIEKYEKEFPIQVLAHIGFFNGILIAFTRDCDEEEAERRRFVIKDMFRRMTIRAARFVRKYY